MSSVSSKHFYDDKAAVEAILAAAGNSAAAMNNGTFRANNPHSNTTITATAGEEEDGEDGSSSFLARLRQNSEKLISRQQPSAGNLEKKGGEQLLETLLSLPASPRILSSSDNENNYSPNECPSSDNGNWIQLDIPISVVSKLDQLFGEPVPKSDEEIVAFNEEVEAKVVKAKVVEVSLPLWVCELLYKASKQMQIPDSLPTATAPIEDTSNKARKGKKAPNTSAGHLLKNTALNRLYECFPNVPQKTIRQCAKENKYDHNLTADQLLHILSITDDFSNNEEEEDNNSQRSEFMQQQPPPPPLIVPSNYPRVIREEEQQRGYSPPAPNLINPEEWQQQQQQQSGLDLEQLNRELDRVENERRNCIEMSKNNTSIARAPLCSYYMRRACHLKTDRNYLQQQVDRIRILRTHNEDFLDLHEMCADRALQNVKFKIDICRTQHPNMRKLQVITGYGKTIGKPSVIRPRLLQFLKQQNIDHSIPNNNQGIVDISLGSVHHSLSE